MLRTPPAHPHFQFRIQYLPAHTVLVLTEQGTGGGGGAVLGKLLKSQKHRLPEISVSLTRVLEQNFDSGGWGGRGVSAIGPGQPAGVGGGGRAQAGLSPRSVQEERKGPLEEK